MSRPGVARHQLAGRGYAAPAAYLAGQVEALDGCGVLVGLDRVECTPILPCPGRVARARETVSLMASAVGRAPSGQDRDGSRTC